MPPAHEREPFFFGDLSGKSAEALLEGQPNGTFLFRNSSAANYLAVSYGAKRPCLCRDAFSLPHAAARLHRAQ